MPNGITGIHISGGSRIGVDCILFQFVTVGSNTLPGSAGFGSPTLENNCFVGAGAKITGNVSLGNRVRVAANAVVTKDVPDDAL